MTGKAEETRRAETSELDFIIVGTGSSAYVLADPLASERNNTVLLKEAGRRDSDPRIHIPAELHRNISNTKVARYCELEPAPELYARRVSWLRSKVLGGSSSISGLIYIRVQRQNFDLWRRFGNMGWSHDERPSFHRRKIKNMPRMNPTV